MGSGPRTYPLGVRLGAALTELLFQPAAFLRRSGGSRIVVAASALFFQLADTRFILVRQCSISMARSAALAANDSACASGIRHLCRCAVALRRRRFTEPTHPSCLVSVF